MRKLFFMSPFIHKLWTFRQQFVRYAIVGCSSFIIDYGLFYILYTFFGWWYLAATALSQIIAISYNFTLNKQWSFSAQGNTHKQIARYMILQTWNYLISIGVLFLLVHYVSLDPRIAKIVVVGIVVTWNFLAYKFFVYRS